MENPTTQTTADEMRPGAGPGTDRGDEVATSRAPEQPADRATGSDEPDEPSAAAAQDAVQTAFE